MHIRHKKKEGMMKEDMEILKKIVVQPLKGIHHLDPSRDVRRKNIAEAYEAVTGISAPLSFSNPGISDLTRDLLVALPTSIAGKLLGEMATGTRFAGSIAGGLGLGAGVLGSRYLFAKRDNKTGDKLIDAIKRFKAGGKRTQEN